MKILSNRLKHAIAALAVLAALAFAGCNAAELSSLRTFAKPYAGAYMCTEARYGGIDLLKEYPSVILTLEEGGTCTLEAVSAAGKKHTAHGSYEYGEGDNILFTATVRGRKYSKNVVFDGGCFVIEQMFAGQKLFLKFEVKG